MTTKDLKDRAIDFKGKKYVLVSDRVVFFNEEYKDGSITTELITSPESSDVIIKAIVKPNDKQIFTGYSFASYEDTSSFVNKTSALENAETSAVGRALAFMGIGVIDSIASIDEINKTTHEIKPKKKKIDPTVAKENAKKAISESNNLEVLMEVEKNIRKSTNLTATDKEELSFLLNERREEFDPTS